MKPIDGYDHLCTYCVVCFCGVFVLLFGGLVCLCSLFCWCCGSLPHYEDIVRFRCGGGVTLPAKCFWCFWGDFVLFWSTLIPFTLTISLYMSVSAR